MGVNYNPKIVTDGLVLCLDAANRRSYSGAGTTWTDLSGNGNNGTLINGPTFSETNGGSIVFDGSDDYCPVDNFLYHQSNSLTVELCLRLNQDLNGGSGFRGIFSNISGVSGYQLFWRPGTSSQYNYFYFYRTSVVMNTFTGSTFNSGEILYFTLIYNYNVPLASSIYINGVDNTGYRATTASNSNSSLPLTIGGPRADQPNQYFLNCNFFFLRFYNRALSLSEAQQNFNATRGRFGI